MDRRRDMILAMTLGLIGAAGSGASAGSIGTTVGFATGNVEADLPNVPGSGVRVIAGTAPDAVPQANWITQSGWINGWDIKDLRFFYNQKTDQLLVGVNTYSIAGNADGNGTPGVPDPRMSAQGGIDPANFGGRKSITLGFASDTANHQLGATVAVAGVPEYKTGGGGLDGFTVAQYAQNGGLQTSYGAALPANNGGLAFDPSKEHPGFEFTVNHFSQIPGIDPKTGFWVQAYAGSPDDVIAGEETIGWVRVPAFAKQTIPEPSTVAGWALLTAGAAWGLRRSRRRAGQD